MHHTVSSAGSASPDLRDASRQLELLVNSVTDYAIYMLDAAGHVQTWNPGGQRIKGYSAEEAIGLHLSRFYTEEEVAQGLPMRNLETARREGRYAGEAWRVRKDGTPFHASVVIDPIWVGDELIGYAKITRDITERYETERRLEAGRQSLLQAQKMEAIGKLTLGLAHDFNNLLTVVVNCLDVIDRRAADPQVSQLVETALRASDRGIVLTRQLLTFGRGQSLAPEPTDISAMLRETEDLYRRCAGDGVTLQFDLGEQLPLVHIDRAQFQAALLNLISNSRDALPNGGWVRINSCLSLTSPPSHDPGKPTQHVRVSVVDNGHGIPHEQQAHVFEPFFTTKDVGRGSGLGLSQVFGFASQSGGHAELESIPGEGTTVSMSFPAPGHPA